MTAREKSKVRRLDQVYAEIPRVNCRGLCHGACGVILMSPLEFRRLSLAVLPRSISEPCPALREGRCSSYERRPLICRLYGVAEGLPCEHGCVPERVLSDNDAGKLIERVAAIGGAGVRCSHDLPMPR
jgi:Fe-S-cluster containining protein